MTTTSRSRLAVSATHLQTAFRRLTKLLPKRFTKSAQLVLRFDNGVLFIDGPGTTVDLPASGSWPGRARLAASFARMLALAPPAGDPLVLEFADGQLVIRGATTLRLRAVWEDISPPRADTVLDLSDRELLKLQAREAPAAIVSSGLERAIRRAELRLQRSIDRAYKSLAEYGLSRDELEKSVRNLIVDL